MRCPRRPDPFERVLGVVVGTLFLIALVALVI
jgi:hypothetical protein